MKFDWEAIGLLLLFLFSISAQASQAKTVTLTTDPNIDMAYTQKIPLIFSNGQFVLNNSIRITPFISVAGNKYNLTAYPSLSSSSQIQDRLYKHKWTLNISKPALVSSFDYVGFDVKGCKKYDDYILHCGGIEIDFSDITSSNYTVALTDTSVNITNSFMLSKTIISLDPTDTLLPNSTNKAYKNATSTTGNCVSSYWLTNTEFTSTEYGNVNVSDDTRYTQVATTPIFDTRCTMYKFTFNVSAVVADLATITEIKFVHEGYYSASIDSYSELYWYNATSGTWTSFGALNMGSDTVISKSFTSTNILASGIATFGVKVYCVFKDAITSRSDIAYMNVTYSSGAATCSLTSSVNPIAFGNMQHGATSPQDTNKTTITNTGDTATQVLINGTAWVSNSYNFLSNYTHFYNATGQTYFNKKWLNVTQQVLNNSLSASGSFVAYLDLWIPSGQNADTYSQTVWYTSVC